MSKKKEAKLEDIIKQIRNSVPKDVGLQFKKWNNLLLIKPEGFLGSDNFSKLQTKITELGGEYVSLGKLSHLRILLEPVGDMDALVAHYENQQKQQQPLPATLNLTIHMQTNTPQDLQKTLDILKKNVEKQK